MISEQRFRCLPWNNICCTGYYEPRVSNCSCTELLSPLKIDRASARGPKWLRSTRQSGIRLRFSCRVSWSCLKCLSVPRRYLKSNPFFFITYSRAFDASLTLRTLLTDRADVHHNYIRPRFRQRRRQSAIKISLSSARFKWAHQTEGDNEEEDEHYRAVPDIHPERQEVYVVVVGQLRRQEYKPGSVKTRADERAYTIYPRRHSTGLTLFSRRKRRNSAVPSFPGSSPGVSPTVRPPPFAPVLSFRRNCRWSALPTSG